MKEAADALKRPPQYCSVISESCSTTQATRSRESEIYQWGVDWRDYAMELERASAPPQDFREIIRRAGVVEPPSEITDPVVMLQWLLHHNTCAAMERYSQPAETFEPKAQVDRDATASQGNMIPTEIVLSPDQRFPVVQKPLNGKLGYFDRNSGEIALEINQTDAEKHTILIHELLHFVAETLIQQGIIKRQPDEAFITNAAPGLLAMMVFSGLYTAVSYEEVFNMLAFEAVE